MFDDLWRFMNTNCIWDWRAQGRLNVDVGPGHELSSTSNPNVIHSDGSFREGKPKLTLVSTSLHIHYCLIKGWFSEHT